MARTTNSDCLRIINNRYKLGIIATQRVRDLHGGEEPVVDRKHDKLTVQHSVKLQLVNWILI